MTARPKQHPLSPASTLPRNWESRARALMRGHSLEELRLMRDTTAPTSKQRFVLDAACVWKQTERMAENSARHDAADPPSAEALQARANDERRHAERIEGDMRAQDDEAEQTHRDNLRWDRLEREAEEAGAIGWTHHVPATGCDERPCVCGDEWAPEVEQ